ncbi:tetratricopeptide repeat protein [Aquisphaera insulae]|uniref:tetratricopeptide repeat protein n=1 Tax=Aquisphaera insulae TaxID=2712864 RepID=UPI0013EDF13D|nr:tetratricopeptide repeat protein [Aquisphaera insulae]
MPIIRTSRDDAPALSGMTTVMASGALALVMGGLGAWGYERLLDRSTTKPASRSAGGSASAADASRPGLDDRVKEVASQVDELRDRMAKLPRTPAPDLGALNERVATLESLPVKLQALEEHAGAVPPRIDEQAKKVASLTADVEGLRAQLMALQSEAKSATKPSSPPATHDGELARASGSGSGHPTLDAGAALFRSGKYAEAGKYFEELTRTSPDDARVWYFAALSRGLATHDWKGRTETLVERGLEREKAGTPDRSEIDAAFVDLTTETGRDWLAYYRKRAEATATNR